MGPCAWRCRSARVGRHLARHPGDRIPSCAVTGRPSPPPGRVPGSHRPRCASLNNLPAPDGSATATVTAIAKSEARRGIHTVPITEQRLYVLARSGSIGDSLRAFSPSGPTPVADYPVLRLSSSQVTAEQSDGVAAFLEFAKQPDQTALLARSGYRAGDAPTAGQRHGRLRSGRQRMRDPRPPRSAALLRLVYR